MSILIKGITIEELKGKSIKIEASNGTVYVRTDGSATDWYWLDSPAVEISTPHGRLIDENEVLKLQFLGDEPCTFVIDVERIEDVPTVVESEGWRC